MAGNWLMRRGQNRLVSVLLILTMLVSSFGLLNLDLQEVYAADEVESALSATIKNYYTGTNNGVLKDWSELLAVVAAGNSLKDFELPDTPAKGSTAVIVSLLKGDMDTAKIKVEALVEEEKIESEGYAYGDALNIIAVEAYNRSVEGTDYNPISYNTTSAIGMLLDYKETDGGFGWGEGGDPDTTGMALIALSLYKTDLDEGTINGAINYLKTAQQNNGGYLGWSGNNANSAAAVILGLIAIGEDPSSNDWVSNSGKTPLDALLSFYVEDGGFGLIDNTKVDEKATHDAVLALADLKKNKSFLTTFTAAEKLHYNIKIQAVDDDEKYYDKGFAVDEDDNLTSVLARLLKTNDNNILGQYKFYIEGIEENSEHTSEENDKIFAIHKQFENIAYFAVEEDDPWGIKETSIDFGTSQTLKLKSYNFSDKTTRPLEDIPIDINDDSFEDVRTNENGMVEIIPIEAKTNVRVIKEITEYDENWQETTVTLIDEKTAVLPAIINMEAGNPQSKNVKIRVEGRTKNLLHYSSFNVENTGDSILTVYDAVVQTLENAGIPYLSDGSYISTINGEEPVGWSGWSALLNDKALTKGMTQVPVESDDEIVVYFGSYPFTIPNVHVDYSDGNLTLTFKESENGIENISVYWNTVLQADKTDAEGKITITEIEEGSYLLQIEKNEGGIPSVLRLEPGYVVTVTDGGASGSVTQNPGVEVAKLYITVIGPNGTIKAKTPYTYSKNITALDLLRMTGLSIHYNDSSKTYVAGIAGYEEFDDGPNSGWLYKVNNNEAIFISAASYVLNPGDDLIWFYTKNFTKESGSNKWKPDEQPEETAPELPYDEKSVAIAVAQFADVKTDSWFATPVGYLYNNGIFAGTSANKFSPEAPLTRAMLASVLARMSGVDLTVYDNNNEDVFTDVSMDNWYGPAVAWAKEVGIVSGYENKDGSFFFRPDDKISRQDIALMIYNFNEKVQKKAYEKVEPIEFMDQGEIPAYAKEAVSSMQEVGIISGFKDKDDNYSFKPTDNTSRAQAASLIYNVLTK